MRRKKSNNNSSNANFKTDSVKREQPRKDSKTKRINFDNERVSKLMNDIQNAIKAPGVHSNEIKYYNRNPKLLEAAARIQFYNITGDPLYNYSEGNPSGALVFEGSAVSGVMSLTWSPQLGGAQGVIAANRAAADMYSFVVHANSRNTSYDPNDLMLMVMSVAEVFSGLTLGVKAYGLMRAYVEENKYLPAMLLRASGFDAEDLKAEYSHMWFDINNLIAQANTLWIPNDMPFVARRMWMNQNVFTDANGAKAQMYTFKPLNFYRYEEVSSNEGGQLVAYLDRSLLNGDPFTGVTALQWNTYVSIMQALITALNDSQYRGVMMGDIKRAYGENILKLSEIDFSYTTPIVYDPLVLSQIENATICKCGLHKIVANASSGLLRAIGYPPIGGSDLIFASSAGPIMTLLNVHHPENPTIEEITEITRLTSLRGTEINEDIKASQVQATMLPSICGTESLCAASIYTMNASGYRVDGFTTVLPLFSQVALTTGKPQYVKDIQSVGIAKTLGEYQNLISALTQFDWAPLVYGFRGNSTDTTAGDKYYTYPGMTIVADLDNCTPIEASVLGRIHTACIYSEFGFGDKG